MTENTPARARRYLVRLNKGFHEVTPSAKNQLLHKYHVMPGTFDMIKLPKQILKTPIKKLSEKELEKVILVEIKSSDRNIDRTLKGLFLGYTYSEQAVAQRLGKKYIIVFVILPRSRSRPFHKIMNYRQLWSKAKTISISFSIRL